MNGTRHLVRDDNVHSGCPGPMDVKALSTVFLCLPQRPETNFPEEKKQNLFYGGKSNNIQFKRLCPEDLDWLGSQPQLKSNQYAPMNKMYRFKTLGRFCFFCLKKNEIENIKNFLLENI